jgi:AraC-like DNA-binding protein
VAVLKVDYQPPDGQVARFVSSFYRLDYEGDPFVEVERADRAQFRFHLRGGGVYRFAGGFVTPSFPVMITGPTTGALEAHSDGTLTIVGWGMLPLGWATLMGSSAGDWVDKALDARTIFGDSVMQLRQRFIDALDVAEQFNISREVAPQFYPQSKSAPFEFTAKVDAWLLSGNDPPVDLLARETDLSQRQLERMTKRYYGMPPKKLARKYRALRAAHLLATGDSFDDNAIGLAFYDQSHLIREVKQFTGLTPGQLRSGHSELTQMTMDGRRALKSNPLISES